MTSGTPYTSNQRTSQRQSRERKTPRQEGSRDAVPAWDYQASGEQLSPSLEQELTRRAQAGDATARDRMIEANIPLVVSVARQYKSPYLETEDLIQEGMIGLHAAVERFEPGRGFRFSTYAMYWIKQRVLRSLDRNGRLIRVPVDVGYAARKAQSARAELTEKLGREPSLAELAEVCGVSPKRLKAVLECNEEPLSLDAALTTDSELLSIEVADPNQAPPDQELVREAEREAIESLLDTLPARDRMVLESRFGLGGSNVPLADLAEKLRMTREGVRQIQRRALLKLRRQLAQGHPASRLGFSA